MNTPSKIKTLEIGEPNEKQKLFFLAKERFVCYGGARGGGKSWAVRKKAELMALRYPGIKILFLRRTLKDLKENHIGELRKDLDGIAVYRDQDAKFSFANGSTLKLGYADSESDITHYQGNEYDVMFLDEATQFTEFMFVTLLGSLRGANAFPKRMYLTCNPGGVGHGWVKRLFIDREFLPEENPADYIFIPAKATDNKVLMDEDPGYMTMLNMLPPDLRAAWRDGSWDIFAGQYFPEFSERWHCENLPMPPKSWTRYAALDYGLDALAAYWAAVEPCGRVHVYREVYATGQIISKAAELITQAGDEVQAFYAPPDLWNRRQDTGRSVAEIFSEHGIFLYKVSNDRVAGWMEVKQALAINFDGEGEDARPIEGPKLKIDAGCRNLIKSFPYLLADEKNVGDVAKEPHEYTHGPDAIRYLLAGRPMYTPTKEELRREWADRWEASYDEQERDFLDYGR